MSRTILVTGVSRSPGTELARRLRAAADVDRVIGVDLTSPADDLGDVEFIRADIRSPVIAKVVEAGKIDTVVHLGTLQPPSGPGRGSSGREIALIGTMQLLAACQRATSVQRFVLQSSTAVYGAGPRDPALFTEDMTPPNTPAAGRSRDIFEMESYVRGFARRRADIAITVLRFAHLAGPTADTALTRHLKLPLVPTVLGFDPRLQFLHVQDAVDVLAKATVASGIGQPDGPGGPDGSIGPARSSVSRTGGHPAIFNVAGDGTIFLSQAIRRLGRPAVPVPSALLPWCRSIVGKGAELPPVGELTYGRVADTTRMRTVLGFRPAYTTAAALASMSGDHDD